LLWLLLFHQFCTASLNRAYIINFIDNIPRNDSVLNIEIIQFLQKEMDILHENIIMAFEILDSHCNKMADINLLNTKTLTISIISKLKSINSGGLIGYCDGNIQSQEMTFTMFTLFHNISYQDMSIFNGSMDNIIPFYFNKNITQKQFIFDPFTVNFYIDKEFAFVLFIISSILCFIVIAQALYYYGNCCRIKINRNNEPFVNSTTKSCFHTTKIYTFNLLMCIFKGVKFLLYYVFCCCIFYDNKGKIRDIFEKIPEDNEFMIDELNLDKTD
jgi:hypothetical protein